MFSAIKTSKCLRENAGKAEKKVLAIAGTVRPDSLNYHYGAETYTANYRLT